MSSEEHVREIKCVVTGVARQRVVHSGLGRRRKVWDARLGDLEAQASTLPGAEQHLARQLKALAAYPTVMYRRLPDGRGCIARVMGAEEDGTLRYALDIVSPIGAPCGGVLGAFTKGRATHPGAEHITLDSPPLDVERELKRELTVYVDSFPAEPTPVELERAAVLKHLKAHAADCRRRGATTTAQVLEALVPEFEDGLHHEGAGAGA